MNCGSVPLAVLKRFEALGRDPRFRHYTRIPRRIEQCIRLFGVQYPCETVLDKLHHFYLFIGIIDDAIDADSLGIGQAVMRQLRHRPGWLDPQATESDAGLATELLKTRIAPSVYARVVRGLDALHRAVVGEKEAGSLQKYMSLRRRVGQLTADVSYRLIEPHLRPADRRLRRFMQQVGAVGCLVDSAIDLDNDARQGLLSFDPAWFDRGRLILQSIRGGLPIVARNPRAVGLFLAAIWDSFRDRSSHGEERTFRLTAR
jgi:hypothetical protein